MKKLSFILFAFFFVGIVACEDELDQVPPGNLSQATYYKTPAEILNAVNATYRALNGFDGRFTEVFETRSDNVYCPGLGGPRDIVPINNFGTNLAINPLVLNIWEGDYRGISRANIVLEKMTADNVPDSLVRKRYEGEVRFIRAFLYFDLIRTYGRVPLIEKEITIEESTVIPRAPIEDVYNLIISDLKTAIKKLPSNYNATPAETGRATSWAAKAMLALVYLTRSGPTYNIDGPGRASNEYSLALPLLDDIIINGKNYKNGAFALTATYGGANGVFSYTNEYNSEIVWDLQAMNNGTNVDSGLGTLLPTVWYEATYGVNTLGLFIGGAEGDAPKEPSQNLMASYPATDTRDNQAIHPGPYSYVLSGVTTTINRPQFIKFLDASKKPTIRFNWPINYPVIRFAQVMLWKAEALLMTSGSSTTVDQLINATRNRAGIPAANNITGATIDDLLAESRREFANEGHRWHDLIRTGKVLTVMNAWIDSEDASRVNAMNNMTANHILFPLPISEIQVNSKLAGDQNPGYE